MMSRAPPKALLRSPRRSHASSYEWRQLAEQVKARDRWAQAHRLAAALSERTDVACLGQLHAAHLLGNWRDDNPARLLMLCEAHDKAGPHCG
jgi:hypothetical protein